MEKCKNLVAKIWLVATIVVVLVGIVFASVIGFNDTVDYSKGYELVVGIDQKADNQAVIEEVTDSFLAEKGIKNAKYSKTYQNDGTYVVYRFNGNVSIDKDALILKIETALNNNNVLVSADYKEFKTYKSSNVLKYIIALVIIAVISFVFILIFGKLNISLTTIITSIISILTYLGLLAVTRVPVCNFIGLFTVFSGLFAIILSTILLFRFKTIVKLFEDAKMSSLGVVQKGVKDGLFRIIAISSAILLAVIALLIIGPAYLRFIALHMLLVLVSALSASLIGCPIVWHALTEKK